MFFQKRRDRYKPFTPLLNMDKLLLILSSLLLLTSCANQYSIAGNSSVPCLDGRMLYLRVSPQNDDKLNASNFVCLDSCKVIHGRFNFDGSMDSVVLAMLYTDNQCVMPVVIENGSLDIQVDNVAQRVTGGPLNDRLYGFFKKRNRIDNEMWELQQKSIRMMREGALPQEIDKRVGRKLQKLSRQSENLEIQFVKDNYDNVLGPGFFLLLCSQYPSPIMTQQIQDILDGAPGTFLNHPYVKSYVQQAERRMMSPMPTITTHSTSTSTTITINCP